jgi:Glycosyl hydrolase family 66/TIR domain
VPLDQVFISYSHEDTKWREELEKHLKPYVRAGSIKGWSDIQIVPGSTWFGEIKSALVQTNVAVLLVTPAFLASDFIHEHELGPLLKEAEQGGVKILWIPVRTSSYMETALQNYQAVIDPGKPLAGMSTPNRDRAWVTICNEIKKAINAPQSHTLRGGYGFLTDYGLYPEAQARGRVATLVLTFGIKEFQFYDWFASYSKPTIGASWPDPFKGARQIYLETIRTYIDEIHRHGGRAWAYVQAVGAEEDYLADPRVRIYRLLDRNGNRCGHPPPPESPRFRTYFLNEAWADRMTGIWGPAVKDLGFDGIHWDTLGPKAGNYGSEVSGTHEFLRRTKESLATLGLSQTLNFVDLAWWNPNLVTSGLVAFPYAEVWSMASEKRYYAGMNHPALAGRWGVMAFYPKVDKPEGSTDSEVMLARWAEAPKHRLMYLILGDNEKRLDGPYFPDAMPLSTSEKAKMVASLPVFP